MAKRKKQIDIDDPLVGLDKALYRLQPEQGVVARRNARADALKELRRLREFINKTFPVLTPRKPKKKRKYKNGAQDWECVAPAVAASCIDLGISVKTEGPRFMVPPWVLAAWIVTREIDHTHKRTCKFRKLLRAGKKSLTRRRTLLVEATYLKEKQHMRQLAKIICDSQAPEGARLTTMEVVVPRIVLAEFNTHRVFCLAGDAELEFDLPAGARGGKYRRVFRMRIDEFVDKWLHGARRYAANPKRELDLSWIEPSRTYTGPEATALLGFANNAAVNTACRKGQLEAKRAEDNRTWIFKGQAILNWRHTRPEHTRFDMRAKLGGMRIRQLNEKTGDIQISNVVDACESGVKDVYEVIAGDYTVAGSKNHRVLTDSGWKTMGSLSSTDFLVVRRFGKHDDDLLDPLRLKKINGRWRNLWQNEERERMQDEDPICRRCRDVPGIETHHIEPVYQNPARAFDRSNITLLCAECHSDMHRKQGWQGGTYLYGAMAQVEDVILRGQEKTYDLEIAGEFPNFIANGVVVHNSRNSASSRAIPIKKMLKRVQEDPYIPETWGKNQKGMQAGEEINSLAAVHAKKIWLIARDQTAGCVRQLLDLGVHKQTTNRLLEPFMWHTIIVTATEWSNFFHLRCHPDAHPAIRRTAEAMRQAMEESVPDKLDWGHWHLPFIRKTDQEEYERSAGHPDMLDWLVKLSSARCARVSYLTHDGVRNPSKDIELHDRLLAAGHMSPFEHPARASQNSAMWQRGNFNYPWMQYRKTIPNEADIQQKKDD